MCVAESPVRRGHAWQPLTRSALIADLDDSWKDKCAIGPGQEQSHSWVNAPQMQIRYYLMQSMIAGSVYGVKVPGFIDSSDAGEA